MTNTKQLTIQILENLESIDNYLLHRYGTPLLEEATSLWKQTLPLIQSLPQETQENKEIRELLNDIEMAIESIEEDEYAWAAMEAEISNLASTILHITPDMEEWQIVRSDEDQELPFELIQDERVMVLQEKLRKLESEDQDAA